MANIQIIIETDNEAFAEHPEAELSRILAELASNIATGVVDEDCSLRDDNGNTVGHLSIEGKL